MAKALERNSPWLIFRIALVLALFAAFAWHP